MKYKNSDIITKQPPSVTEAINFIHDTKLENDKFDSWKNSARLVSHHFYNNKITFTTNVFIPVTFLCRNKCTYCGFRRKNVIFGEEYIKPENITKILKKAQNYGVSEILITMGEKPEYKYPTAQKYLNKLGFNSTIDYVYFIAEKALEYGLLSHINAGSLSYDELVYLRDVSASVGLMLEILGTRLSRKGMPHMKSPDKHPKKRLTTIKDAGKLKIPFTTGILIGIGETTKEIISSLFALRNIHIKYGHLQEIIIQNFMPNKLSNMRKSPPASLDLLERIVIMARHILPFDVSIQIPPNLIIGHEHRFIESGMSDWGGISSITPDYINLDHPWPLIDQLKSLTNEIGYELKERLPVYPKYITQEWLSSRVYDLIKTKKLINKDRYRKRHE